MSIIKSEMNFFYFSWFNFSRFTLFNNIIGLLELKSYLFYLIYVCVLCKGTLMMLGLDVLVGCLIFLHPNIHCNAIYIDYKILKNFLVLAWTKLTTSYHSFAFSCQFLIFFLILLLILQSMLLMEWLNIMNNYFIYF